MTGLKARRDKKNKPEGDDDKKKGKKDKDKGKKAKAKWSSNNTLLFIIEITIKIKNS